MIATEQQRAELATLLSAQKEVCFDTETTGVDPLLSELVGLSLLFVKVKHITCLYLLIVNKPREKLPSSNLF